MKLILSALLFIFLFGCSTDPYEKYVGFWTNDANQYDMLQILHDGETYLVNEPLIKGSKQVLLSKSEGQLVVKSGLVGTAISISADGEKIYTQDKKWSKTSKADFERKYAEKYERYEKYVGFWSLDPHKYIAEKNRKRVFEITRSGEDYFINDAIDKSEKPSLLTKSEGQLFLGSTQLFIHDNQKEIDFQNNKPLTQNHWSKLTQDEFENKVKEIAADKKADEEKAIKEKEIEAQRAAQQKEAAAKAAVEREARQKAAEQLANKKVEDRNACQELRKGYNSAVNTIPWNTPHDIFREKKQVFIDEYKEKVKNKGLTDCVILF